MTLPNITINGRAVADLELRFTGSGKAVASVRVAASERRKNAQTQEWEDGEKCFVNVSLWESEAEAAAEMGVLKGDAVLVTGSLFEREYETRDGGKGKSLEVKYATIAKVPPRVRDARQQPAQQSGGWGNSAPAGDPWATPAPGEPAPF